MKCDVSVCKHRSDDPKELDFYTFSPIKHAGIPCALPITQKSNDADRAATVVFGVLVGRTIACGPVKPHGEHLS